jgi:hypothetical protein
VEGGSAGVEAEKEVRMSILMGIGMHVSSLWDGAGMHAHACMHMLEANPTSICMGSSQLSMHMHVHVASRYADGAGMHMHMREILKVVENISNKVIFEPRAICNLDFLGSIHART